MSKGVLYDANKCIGCRACQVACKQWNELPAENTTNRGTYENPEHLSANTFTKLRFREITGNDGDFHWVFAKIQCMHCEEPGCVEACIVGALQKSDNGPVVYDDRKCIGCRYCQVACPFGIPTFQWGENWPWIRKCTFCADRVGAGLQPACVTTCPTGALKFGERDDLIKEARARIEGHPDEYVNHIYGEKEVGGTSWLYLSPVPFEQLDFPNVQTTAVTTNPSRAMACVPPVLLGVAAAMTGVYWYSKRRNKLDNEKRKVEK